MTGNELMAVIVFSITVFGFISGVWYRVEGKIEKGKTEAAQKGIEAAVDAAAVRSDLAAYKLHVSETYSTKSGLREIKDEVLAAVTGIRDDVRHLASRIDNMHELTSTKRPIRRAAD